MKQDSEKAGLKLNIQKTKILAFGPISPWQIDGEKITVTNLIFLDSKITADGDCSCEIKLAPWKKRYDQPRQPIKKQRHYFAIKHPYNQSYGFSSSHVWMWELDHKECWALKYLCFWTVVSEKTLESPLDCKETKPVNPKGNKSWMFIGCWSWSSNTLATWCEEQTRLKRPWCRERLKAGEEEDDRDWGGFMAYQRLDGH